MTRSMRNWLRGSTAAEPTESPSPVLRRIISGVQSGVDLAALHAAFGAGLPTGGCVPPGSTQELDVSPLTDAEVHAFPLDHLNDFYPERLTGPELQDRRARLTRTYRNVQFADGTLVLAHSAEAQLSGGTLATWRAAAKRTFRKLEDPRRKGAAPDVANWIRANKIRVLNVAGPPETDAPGIYEDARQFLSLVLRELGYPNLVHRLAAELRPGLRNLGDKSQLEGLVTSSLSDIYSARSEFNASAQHILNLGLLAITGGGGVFVLAVFPNEPVSWLETARVVSLALFLIAALAPWLLRHKLRAGYDLYVASCLHGSVLFTALGLPPTHQWLEFAHDHASTLHDFRPCSSYTVARRWFPDRERRRVPRTSGEYCAAWRNDPANLYTGYTRALLMVRLVAIGAIIMLAWPWILAAVRVSLDALSAFETLR